MQVLIRQEVSKDEKKKETKVQMNDKKEGYAVSFNE